MFSTTLLAETLPRMRANWPAPKANVRLVDLVRAAAGKGIAANDKHRQQRIDGRQHDRPQAKRATYASERIECIDVQRTHELRGIRSTAYWQRWSTVGKFNVRSSCIFRHHVQRIERVQYTVCRAARIERVRARSQRRDNVVSGCRIDATRPCRAIDVDRAAAGFGQIGVHAAARQTQTDSILVAITVDRNTEPNRLIDDVQISDTIDGVAGSGRIEVAVKHNFVPPLISVLKLSVIGTFARPVRCSTRCTAPLLSRARPVHRRNRRSA